MHGISYFFPMAWFSNAVRQLFTAGRAAHYSENLLVLLALGVGFYLLANLVFRYRQRKLSN